MNNFNNFLDLVLKNCSDISVCLDILSRTKEKNEIIHCTTFSEQCINEIKMLLSNMQLVMLDKCKRIEYLEQTLADLMDSELDDDF